MTDVTSLSPELFRAAMSPFPAGVTIVTTTDRQGERSGFTATAFCSLSLEPPLVLVCLAKSAGCFDAFTVAESYVIHLVDQAHRDLALIRCDADRVVPAGDHVVLIGRVVDVAVHDDRTPLIQGDRAFGRLMPCEA